MAGQVLYRIVNVTDISSHKAAEIALQEAVLGLETLIASLQSGVLVEDSQGQIVLTNQALCDMIGLGPTPESLIGVPMAVFAQRIRLLFVDVNGLLMRLGDFYGGRQLSRSHEMKLTDGRVFELDYTPVFSSGGLGYHLWQLRDVTDRRKIERQLRGTSAVPAAQKRDLERQKQELETAYELLDTMSTRLDTMSTRLETMSTRLEMANLQFEARATTDGLIGLLNHRMFE